MENCAKICGYGPLSSFLELLQPKGKGPIGRGGWNYSSTEKLNEQAVGCHYKLAWPQLETQLIKNSTWAKAIPTIIYVF